MGTPARQERPRGAQSKSSAQDGEAERRVIGPLDGGDAVHVRLPLVTPIVVALLVPEQHAPAGDEQREAGPAGK